MTCMSFAAFVWFLSVTGLEVTERYPVYIVHSRDPALYLWTGKQFCVGGRAA